MRGGFAISYSRLSGLSGVARDQVLNLLLAGVQVAVTLTLIELFASLGMPGPHRSYETDDPGVGFHVGGAALRTLGYISRGNGSAASAPCQRIVQSAVDDAFPGTVLQQALLYRYQEGNHSL